MRSIYAASSSGRLTVRFAAVGLNSEDHDTPSLRRTKASILYKQTGTLRAAQISRSCRSKSAIRRRTAPRVIVQG